VDALVVIACYKPKDGCEAELDALVAEHLPALRAEGLVSDHPVMHLRGADGSWLEIFEWKSVEASRSAHENPRIGALWGRFAAVCEFTPLASLPEAQQLFAHFGAAGRP
jgi:hypothetical protein